MPEPDNTIPLPASVISQTVPGSPTTAGESAMLDNNEAITAYVKQHIREIVPFLRAKCSEKGYSNELVMKLTEIPRSTFYRIWKIGTPDEEVDPSSKKPYVPSPDTICRICTVVGVSLTEHANAPTDNSTVKLPGLKENSHEIIMDNMWKEISDLRETITKLEADRERLETENARLANIAFSREDDIRTNIARNNKLSDALIEAHERMHKITEDCNARVDKLLSAILDNK